MRQGEFDKVCNPERGWSFERVVDAQLDGHDHKRLDGIESRGECARLCLLEKDFDCRSVTKRCANTTWSQLRRNFFCKSSGLRKSFLFVYLLGPLSTARLHQSVSSVGRTGKT